MKYHSFASFISTPETRDMDDYDDVPSAMEPLFTDQYGDLFGGDRFEINNGTAYLALDGTDPDRNDETVVDFKRHFGDVAAKHPDYKVAVVAFYEDEELEEEPEEEEYHILVNQGFTEEEIANFFK